MAHCVIRARSFRPGLNSRRSLKTMDPEPRPDVSYISLFRVPGFGRFAATILLGRGAQSMWLVGIVLFVLARFHSAGLAGLVVFLGIFPALLMSPLAGALIDRYGRVRFVTFDYFVAALSLVGIVGLSLTHLLTPGLLFALVVLGSLTGMLSAAGLRTMVPLMLPRHLWDRGNAADSVGYTAVAIAGPALAGGLVGWLGAETALLVTAAVFAAGGVLMIGMREPGTVGQSSVPFLRDAVGAIGYVVRNVTLRGIALCLFILNVGAGILIVTLPVLVLDHLHGGATQVGLIWAAQGAGGVVSALLFGRLDSEGRERLVMVVTAAVAAAATALLLVAGNLPVVAMASLVIGLATGPLDVAIFSLRQRATEVAWFGRAMAVSMSLNFAGNPIGSVITGPLPDFRPG